MKSFSVIGPVHAMLLFTQDVILPRVYTDVCPACIKKEMKFAAGMYSYTGSKGCRGRILQFFKQNF